MAVTATGRAGSDGANTQFQGQQLQAHYYDFSATDGLTALAGGAQGGTSLADYQVNRFTTVASANDSAQLPAAKAGRMRIVTNAAAANSLVVFPQTGEFINALTVNSGFTIAANKTAIFVCAVDGTWNSLLTA